MSADAAATLHRPAAPPACSVILPTYNRAAFLPEAFDAIRKQTFTDWELIVVDDGSTDDSDAIIRKEIARTPQFVRHVTQANAGAYAARNTGLDLARGRYIAFYDSDDLWLPHHLAQCAAALDTHQDLDWVYAACRMVDHATGREINASTFRINGKPNAFLSLRTRRDGDLRIIDDPGVARCSLRHGLYSGLQNSVIRRRVFNAHRLIDNTRNESEDQVFHAIAVASGHRFGYYDDVHVVYRVHHDNSSSAATGMSLLNRRRPRFVASAFIAWFLAIFAAFLALEGIWSLTGIGALDSIVVAMLVSLSLRLAATGMTRLRSLAMAGPLPGHGATSSPHDSPRRSNRGHP